MRGGGPARWTAGVQLPDEAFPRIDIVLGPELLPPFPSVRPMDATTGSGPSQASPALSNPEGVAAGCKPFFGRSDAAGAQIPDAGNATPHTENHHSSLSPTLLHAFVLGYELLPSFPSVKPMGATTGS